jgi:wyosine [tRNA(Phe)-imidazoG37] synthetase (radical SAM superfamily)
MKPFSISEVYKDKYGFNTVDINPLPENYCSFDCVFCPLGRTAVKTDERFIFEETKDFIKRLSEFLELNDIQVIFLNPDGEAMANKELIDVIKLIKSRGKKVRILTNGYLLNKLENKEVLELCDEVIGELFAASEEDFQKINRPLKGYTLEEHVNNMTEFKRWFNGKFILDITLIKNYSDSDEAVAKLRDMINEIKPDEVNVETPNKNRFKGTFTVDEEKFLQIMSKLLQK